MYWLVSLHLLVSGKVSICFCTLPRSHECENIDSYSVWLYNDLVSFLVLFLLTLIIFPLFYLALNKKPLLIIETMLLS